MAELAVLIVGAVAAWKLWGWWGLVLYGCIGLLITWGPDR